MILDVLEDSSFPNLLHRPYERLQRALAGLASLQMALGTSYQTSIMDKIFC